MSDLSIDLTEKSYTFPFKHTSLDPVALNPIHMLPRQTWKVEIFIVGFKLISIKMETQAKFCVCFTKINTKLFLS